jgi:hypothetical protein
MKLARRFRLPKHLLIKLSLQYLTLPCDLVIRLVHAMRCRAVAVHKVARRTVCRHILFDQRAD